MAEAAANNALITVAEAQAIMNDLAETNKAYLQSCINVLSGVFDNICYPDGEHTIIQQTYTDEIYSGSGRDMLFLRAYNVTAITKIEYRVDKDTWVELDKAYYEIDPFKSGVCGFNGYTFARIRNHYRITYTAGWEQGSVPGAIIEAFYSEFPRLAERRRDIQANSFGGMATANTTYRNVRRETQEALFPFRKDLL